MTEIHASDPQTIETAPPGDGWILVYEPASTNEFRRVPWIVATRCDDGWCDDEGYTLSPTHWAPLPDPQPAGSGWGTATGFIFLTHVVAVNVAFRGWVVGVVGEDGLPDPQREGSPFTTLAAARLGAEILAEKLGLEIVERDAMPPPQLAYSGVPKVRRLSQPNDNGPEAA